MAFVYNTADAVMRDAEEADQEFTAPSELCKIRATFGNCAKYLKHLDNSESHLALRKNIQAHLWTHHKCAMADVRLDMHATLFDK